MNTVQPMYEWNNWSEINWKVVERQVFKLQKRIYKASQKGNVKLVHKLQRLLLKSYFGKLWATRRVTQDNKGKKTAGVDGVKKLAPKARFKLANSLNLGVKTKPTRRVWIPKPHSDEKRPLGIPTMYDRALQCLVKLALEPEWEAKFEPNSYGFRPGRSTHDAIVAIQQSIKHQEKYVLDADISKCFDKINHDKLLEKLETFSNLKKQIKSWLKAGVLDKWSFEPTNEGTPQGGIISPLLANIALHGMEEKVKEIMGKGINKRRQLSLIRYADDFVILHKDLEVIIRAKKVISEWLSELNLELKPSKTRISHTLHEFEGNVGFNFLGFNVRQYPVGKHHSGIQKGRGQAKILGFKTLIKPGKNNIKTHVQKCHEVIKKHTSAPQGSLIKHLNPIIKGWCNYYSIGVSNEVFHKLDFITYSQLKRWGERRHPNKGRKWVARKYWHSIKNQNWVFATKEGDKFTSKLYGHQETKIARHVKVAGTRSPFDGDWIYWSSRMGKHPTVKKSTAKLLKKQKGKCNYCEMYFREDDVIEKDHIIPKTLGGKDTYNNIQLLHRHCHDVKTAQDGSACSYKDNTKEKPDEKETLTSGFEDEFVW